MLLTVQAGPYSIRGISVGGVYNSLHVPQLGILLDVGIALRSLASVSNIFLTHGHADHAAALGALLGIRALSRVPPPRVILPAAIADDLLAALAAQSRLQGFELAIEPVPVEAGSELEIRADLTARVLAASHVVPVVAYQFFSRVQKLRPEFSQLPGPEIGRRRLAGEDLFDTIERLELAYVTDTVPDVLEANPSLFETRVLILECTFLDDRKSREVARKCGHVHLDDLLALAPRLRNEAVVLMHFSQQYSPSEVHAILRARCPPELQERLVVFAPRRGAWPG
jgi:ribonuclease Z